MTVTTIQLITEVEGLQSGWFVSASRIVISSSSLNAHLAPIHANFSFEAVHSHPYLILTYMLKVIPLSKNNTKNEIKQLPYRKSCIYSFI